MKNNTHTQTSLALLGLLAALLPCAARAQLSAPQSPAPRNVAPDTWVGTDALGRTLPNAPRAPRANRFVGIFYFLTQGSQAYYKQDPKTLPYVVYGSDPHVLNDNTEIIKRVGGDTLTQPEAWKDVGDTWWGQPAVGYFLADDPWVIRHNLSMLAEAGVDVLIFDVTNGPQYSNDYHAVLDTAEQMRKEGSATPQFMFITYSSTGVVANQLYDALYAKGLYKDLWFRWQGKPLLFGDPKGSSPTKTLPRPEVAAFFNWRYSWANTKGPNGNGKDEWQWADSGNPLRYGWHTDPAVPEEVSVMAGGWANGNMGRSFTGSDQPRGIKGHEPPLDQYDLAADRERGLFFAQQWRSALHIDPQFVFVTGWNEWTAGRQYNPGVTMLGHVTKTGQYYYVDNFNEEFSRDIMPMHGGYGDNYYMQLVGYIRQYKGACPLPIAHGFHTIALAKPMSQWNAAAPTYMDAIGDTTHRNWNGWKGFHYTDNSGRNDITTAKVACDAKTIAFCVHTNKPLTKSTDPHWMQLLLDTDQNPDTGLHGYDFMLNSRVLSPTQTTLTRLKDGKTWTVPYRAVGHDLQILVPRALLGMTDPHSTAFDFHWIDNVDVAHTAPADWWYQGDSAPDGRFNYRYTNTR